MSYSIYAGDCIDQLAKLPENSVDSVVCDPPYGLSKEPDIVEVMTHWINGDDYIHRGGGFMGKKWDSFVPGPSVWKAIYRVLKPGGYLLAFAGTRTVDLMGIAIRLGGFEIRDTIHWIYGSGFPKSLNVAKAIDKAAGSNDEEAVAWGGWGTSLKPSHEPILLCRKPLSEKTVVKNVLKHGTGALNIDGTRVGIADGFGGGRKATSGFVNGYEGDGFAASTTGRWPANTILTHSAGCKQVGTYQVKGRTINRWDDGAKPFGGGAGHEFTGEQFPDDEVVTYECESGCPVAEMDTQSGERKAGGKVKGHEPSRTGQNGIYGHWGRVENQPHNDKGGASRFFQIFEQIEEDPGFFYGAKATKSERNLGLDKLEDKAGTAPVGTGLKCRKCEKQKVNMPGSMCVCDEPDWYVPVSNGLRKNFHPTVKPVKLMQYLCRLVTPPGGAVLDPFMGSGTTGVAALKEGFRFIGVEKDETYAEIYRARLRYAANGRGTVRRVVRRR